MNPVLLSYLLIPFLSFSTTASHQLGIQFSNQTGPLPLLNVPYGTWRASNYSSKNDIYIFKNIRFAAPPVGNLRWAKPAPPAREASIQDGSYGPICIQAPFGTQNSSVDTTPFPPASEDCLFLDIYVPAKAIRDPSLRLPVISWIYGGAYISGGKDIFTPLLPLYDGTGPIEASNGNVIFVTSNYRLGAYGFLAGSTMENSKALTNAGLYDQRAVLQWIQTHIHHLGGDKSRISAWGQSAGAGSILHHLTAHGGSQDPLFSKAVLQSPGFLPLFDRRGYVEDTFRQFEKLAGCEGRGVACLRLASGEALEEANLKVNEMAPEGIFKFGPTADGGFVRQLAVVEFAQGNYWKPLTSLILSHVADEAELFVPNNVQTNQAFNNYINDLYPPYAQKAGINALIEARYPPILSTPNSNTTPSTQRARVKSLLHDLAFLCNTLTLFDAYRTTHPPTKVFSMQYSIPPALHSSDVAATFYNTDVNLTVLGEVAGAALIPGFGEMATTLQGYFVTQAGGGDPNGVFLRGGGGGGDGVFAPIRWPRAFVEGDGLGGTLDVGVDGFKIFVDDQVSRNVCGFLRDVAVEVTDLGGYAPRAVNGHY